MGGKHGLSLRAQRFAGLCTVCFSLSFSGTVAIVGEVQPCGGLVGACAATIAGALQTASQDHVLLTVARSSLKRGPAARTGVVGMDEDEVLGLEDFSGEDVDGMGARGMVGLGGPGGYSSKRDLGQTLAAVQKLAVAVANGTEVVSDTMQELLESIKADLQQINDTIFAEHGVDQKAVDQARDSFAECEAHLPGDTESTSASIAEAKHASCRTKEAALHNNRTEACNRYNKTMDSSRSTPCMLEFDAAQSAREYEKMGTCVEQMLEWLIPFNATSSVERAQCAAAKGAHERQIVECNAAQRVFESETCRDLLETGAACAQYDSCRAGKEAQQNAAHERVRVAEDARHSGYIAAAHIQCYLAVLNASADQRRALLGACKVPALPAAGLRITYHETPRGVPCEAAPGSTRPCDAEWLAENYHQQDWYIDAPTAACTPCDHTSSTSSSTSTTTTTSTTAKVFAEDTWSLFDYPQVSGVTSYTRWAPKWCVVGNKVVGIPWYLSDIAVLDVESGSQSRISGLGDSRDKYAGTSACHVVDDKVYAMPYSAPNIVAVDPHAGTWEKFTDYEDGRSSKYLNSYLVGRTIYGVPWSAGVPIVAVHVDNRSWSAVPGYIPAGRGHRVGVLDGHKMFLPPGDAAMNKVVVVDTRANIARETPACMPAGESNMYLAAAVVGGKLVALPFNPPGSEHASAVVVDTHTEECSTLPIEWETPVDYWWRHCEVSGEKAFFFNENGNSVAVFDPSSTSLRALTGASGTRFYSVGSVGSSIFAFGTGTVLSVDALAETATQVAAVQQCKQWLGGAMHVHGRLYVTCHSPDHKALHAYHLDMASGSLVHIAEIRKDTGGYIAGPAMVAMVGEKIVWPPHYNDIALVIEPR
mmetsp:Transcript_130057/g.324192  ORF Transcript_130057/g.324192 Transcript_130057/m.324192 type:complete len:872 (-) Transcript_130057:52-2667(-)|eukprot:CAMPEP_0115183206 /NCGR_PEP_ID=MMETSP0270-20121206/8336_1 /TAXON_ID=71861 /ORGANISM="Scrippsiella trochoidea, Strain CCMP3099" /LENGTH=871 /DNA_ID=CAMNT_0002596271 /DNA_START=26 /DNA_END=2641 /DNA_ORIENTATION=+